MIMLTSIINRILNKLPPVFTKRNKFELPIELKSQPTEVVIPNDVALAVNEIEAVAEIEAEPVSADPVIIKSVNIEPPKAIPVVGIFVDLDNVIGQLGDYKTEQAVLRNIDLFFIHMAKCYEGQVQVNVYGNLSCWRLKEAQFELENISVNYIDTPVVNDYDKTTTDHKMVVDMMDAKHTVSQLQCVLVTCDAGFMHVAESYQEKIIPVELIQFGPTNYRLKLIVNTIVNGFDILKEAKIIKHNHVTPRFYTDKPTSTGVIAKTKRPTQKYADDMLIEAIKSSDGEYVLAQASQLLKEFKTDNWRGYKTFTQFVESLNIPNLTIDKEQDGLLSINEPVVVDDVVETKLKQMKVPVLNAKQYDSIFNTLAKCSLDKEPSQLVETTYEYCKKTECTVTREELENIITKVLPYIKKSNKPYVLAAKYLKWLFQKSKVSFKGILNSQDRENLTLLIQG
jgi:hypothetical protein